MVVSPISSSLLGVGPVAYPLVMGDINLVKLLKILRPKVSVLIDWLILHRIQALHGSTSQALYYLLLQQLDFL